MPPAGRPGTSSDIQREDRRRNISWEEWSCLVPISHGILNEIYYPRVDHACTRDLGLIVTDRKA